jgi:hypothetical protein
MRLFEKRSPCLDGRRSLFKRCLHKFEFPQILSRYEPLKQEEKGALS